MRRTIVEPADLSSAALGDFKAWLGISRPGEDSLLLDLLKAALATCEAFIGQAPLSQLVEERVPTRAGATLLSSRPVASFAMAEIVAQDGSRSTLGAESFNFELQPDGSARFELLSDASGQAVTVRIRAGLAGTWSDIPAPLKQGIIRLGAFFYRDRDRTVRNRTGSEIPASVTALWQPWKSLRLA